jgi:hypothetical protein
VPEPEALPIERSTNNQPGQAMTEDIMGRLYMDLGQEDKALELFRPSLVIWRSLEIRQVEANTLTYMGNVHNNLGSGRRRSPI